MTRPTTVEIDFNSLKHNLQVVRSLAPKSKVLSMIKANAYGHGLVRVARALQETDAFGVACIDEALIIRQAGITTPIVIMAGFFSPDELELIERLNCSVVVHHQEQVDQLSRLSRLRAINVWIKIDTGMHRLGFLPEHVSKVYQELQQNPAVRSPMVLATHFSDADDVNCPKTSQQLSLFHQITKDLDGERSLANSAGILNFPESHDDWVRPGLMLYGVSPIAGKQGSQFGLKPAMTLRSKIIEVRDQRQGDKIGYCSAFTCPTDMRIGIIAIGYGDGYPFHNATRTPVLIGSHLCHIIGRVAMDMVAVDLHTFPEAKIGEDVVLWGQDLPVEHIAEVAHSIPYELLCGIARRVHGAE